MADIGSNQKFFTMLSTILMKVRTECLNSFSTGLFVLFACFAHSQDTAFACKLLQPAELELALNGKATQFSNYSMGTSHICSGKVGKLNVMIRLAESKNKNGGATEQQGADILRSKGWQINVKKDGDITCATAIPPAESPEMSYNTTASKITKGKVVAVEVVALSKNEMASMDTVRDLVQKASSRL
jgi:hypothetical protein